MRFVRRIAAAAALCWALSACTIAQFNDVLTPTDSFVPGYGLPYGSAPRQLLDVYTPKRAEGPRPVVVFFYGGGWVWGERWQYKFVGEALAARGYVAVLPDYRLFPEARFPEFVEDGAAAVAWTEANIARYGGDPQRIFLMGHSAGAHIGALLALDRLYLEQAGATPARGFIGLSGPYAFDPSGWPDTAQIFALTGGRTEHAIPARQVRADAPPMLLLHGRDDSTVRASETQKMAAALRAAGARVETQIYPGIGHAGIVLALSRPFRWRAPVLAETDRFISETLAEDATR